jgi:hyperosmotically inducible periplasmic protein
MNRSLTPLLRGVALTVLLISGVAGAAQDSQQAAPDNTKVNKADRDNGKPSADQAKNKLSDREVMRQIRRDVVKDKSLSTYGHNVKIIAQNGKVTLRGPVHSEDEKTAIREHASHIAGEENVTDELTVKGDKK